MSDAVSRGTGRATLRATAAKTTATTTITWQTTEATQVSPSQPTVAQIAMTPKTARGIVQVSRQFMLQVNPEAWLRRELLRTAATIADTAIIQGSGAAGQPLGVLNTTGLSTQSGTSLAWSGVLHMKKLAADANVQDGSIAFISTPAVRETLEARARDATNGSGFIWQDNAIASCPAFATTLMPSATMLSGPWSQVLFVTWGGGITVQINPYDPSLFKAGTVQIGVALSCDVGIVCDPAAFTKAASIT